MKNKVNIWGVLSILIVIGYSFSYFYYRESEMLVFHLNDSCLSPTKQHWFGTDTMGRDLYAMVWYGGSISLWIGMIATCCSTICAILYGGISGFFPRKYDVVAMKLLDFAMSIPTILWVLFAQSMVVHKNSVTIGIVIGITSWFSMAKIIHSEVQERRSDGHILCAKQMGASLFYIVRVHIVPQILSNLWFMITMNIGKAMITEATLSFLGLGLPVEQISLGMLIGTANEAFLGREWWLIVFPAVFFIVTVMSIMKINHNKEIQ